ncbi:MAG: hypothetical protein EON95_08620 [Caulobacteraceae bacterium]|nr:MAG: hypothetical protein EON95_08620 [Caulobacteraceae bacterium]
MKFVVLIAACAAGVLATPALARETAAPPAAVAGQVVAAGTPVTVATTAVISTADNKTGDMVAMTLSAPLSLNGQTVIPAGTPVAGQIVHANTKLGGGRPGEMHIAPRYIDFGGQKIRLRGLQIHVRGNDLSKASVWAIGGVKGSEIEAPAGLSGQAQLADDVMVGPGGLTVAPGAPPKQSMDDIIPAKITAPAAGMGKIIVYRESVFVAGGYPLDVRYGPDFNGNNIGTLYSGQYLVMEVAPGTHVISARKDGADPIVIEIEPGDAYFVKGVAMGLGASPPTIITSVAREDFALISGKLKPKPKKK